MAWRFGSPLAWPAQAIRGASARAMIVAFIAAVGAVLLVVAPALAQEPLSWPPQPPVSPLDGGGDVAAACSVFTFRGDAANFWQAASNCTGCLAVPGCRFCLQTMECAPAADVDATCFELAASSPAQCPARPPCAGLGDTCESCVVDASCAWCASQRRCMPTEETFAAGCRGTVYERPCPTAARPTQRLWGDLFVEPDPDFGGGRLVVRGGCGPRVFSAASALSIKPFHTLRTPYHAVQGNPPTGLRRRPTWYSITRPSR